MSVAATPSPENRFCKRRFSTNKKQTDPGFPGSVFAVRCMILSSATGKKKTKHSCCNPCYHKVALTVRPPRAPAWSGEKTPEKAALRHAVTAPGQKRPSPRQRTNKDVRKGGTPVFFPRTGAKKSDRAEEKFSRRKQERKEREPSRKKP